MNEDLLISPEQHADLIEAWEQGATWQDTARELWKAAGKPALRDGEYLAVEARPHTDSTTSRGVWIVRKIRKPS